MLPQKQQQVLIDILSEESAKFDDCLKRFEDSFSKTEYFTASWTVQHMIQHNVQFFAISLVIKSQTKIGGIVHPLRNISA